MLQQHTRTTRGLGPVVALGLAIAAINPATGLASPAGEPLAGTSQGVAVGMPAYPTPTGLFAIQTKQVNPTWTAPDSPWAGEMAGQSVAGGAVDNPLKARWMGVDGSVGIHGTGQPWTIGTRASHGCIRMSVPDVIDLFRRVSIGTPVLIK
jgi:lipoprotein-anchoring transpeptidase ErfK/SrfK